MRSADQLISPLAGGGGGSSDSGRPMRLAGTDRLIILVAIVQVFGFVIPLITRTIVEGPVPEAETTLTWTYEAFSWRAPGLLDWVLYLPATGLAALGALYLPTKFLRPVALGVLGFLPLYLLSGNPGVFGVLLERLDAFSWSDDRASQLRGLTLVGLAIAAGIMATEAPKWLVVPIGILAAAPAVVYTAVPLESEFGGFAWMPRFEMIGAAYPDEPSWSEVTSHYMMYAALGMELLAMGLGAIMCLVAFRDGGELGCRVVRRCVWAILGATLLTILAGHLRPLYEEEHTLVTLGISLAGTLKMFLATLGLVLLPPVAVIDLAGRAFGTRW